MKFHLERFRGIFPEIRDELFEVLPEHVRTYESFVRRLGPDCTYARAALKVIFIEATRTHGERFEQSLRLRGYS